jgi:hypothetical protein
MKYQKNSVAAHPKQDQCSEALNARTGPGCELCPPVPIGISNELNLGSHWERTLALPAPRDETDHVLFWSERDFNFPISD